MVITLREQLVQDCLNAVTVARKVFEVARGHSSNMSFVDSGYAYHTLEDRLQKATSRNPTTWNGLSGETSSMTHNCRSLVTYSEYPSTEPTQRAMACRSRDTYYQFSGEPQAPSQSGHP